MISVLCTDPATNYHYIKGVDLWPAQRDAYYFTGSNPVITHAPCAQWARLKGLAHNRPDEKELAFHCLKKVLQNGGIFEHPNGSTFFKEVGINENQLVRIDQTWFGYGSAKTTKLFFHKFEPIDIPTSYHTRHRIPLMNVNSKVRSRMTTPFCLWLCACIDKNYLQYLKY